MVEVKICGINTPEAMKAASRAEFIGFVFYQKSIRFINAAIAKELAKLSPKKQKLVGLFVNSENNVIEYINEFVGLDIIQLHGEESIEKIRYLKQKLKKPIIKSVPVSSKNDIKKYKNYIGVCDMFLFDSNPGSNKLPGGNGKIFNWKVLDGFKTANKWMLAGGLNNNNLKEAIKITKAPIVDASSGLEKKKGIKCPLKIKEFIKLAHSIKHE